MQCKSYILFNIKAKDILVSLVFCFNRQKNMSQAVYTQDPGVPVNNSCSITGVKYILHANSLCTLMKPLIHFSCNSCVEFKHLFVWANPDS